MTSKRRFQRCSVAAVFNVIALVPLALSATIATSLGKAPRVVPLSDQFRLMPGAIPPILSFMAPADFDIAV